MRRTDERIQESIRPRTLKAAAEQGIAESVLQHIQAGADVNARTANGHFALGGAVINGHAQVVEILLQHGADVNLKSEYGWTPLYLAAWMDHPTIARQLVDAGGDLDSRTRGGYNSPDRWTALHVAASRGHLEVIKVLAKAGARLDSRDGQSRTPRDIAVLFGQLVVARYLKRRTATQTLVSKAGGRKRPIVKSPDSTKALVTLAGRQPGSESRRCGRQRRSIPAR